MTQSNDMQPDPDWRCSNDDCPSFDGSRCKLLGYAPSEFCEPKLKLVKIQLKKRKKRVRTLKLLIKDLAHTDSCDLDRNGNCQAHDWFALGECPHARAMKILKPSVTIEKKGK